MTQTLTTEAMQEIYEAAVHSEASGSQEAEFELLCKLEDIGGTSATIRKLIDMVRAANREAQPVAVTQFTPIADLYAVRIFDNGSAYVRDAAEALRISKRNDNAEIVEYVHIKRLQDSYTAPPAPAVRTANCPFCGRRQPDGGN
ncbi:TPA: hypothetical protein ACKPW5_003099 [Serratia marcescens]